MAQNLLPLKNVRAFTGGRVQAGQGWYKPDMPDWMQIAVPAVEGTSKGVQAGLAAKAGGAGTAGTAPKYAASADTGSATLGDLLTQSQATVPEMAAQAPVIDWTSQYATPPALDPRALTLTEAGTPGTPEATMQQKLKMVYEILARLQAEEGRGGTYIRSSRTVKREIVPSDDRRALGEVLRTPVYRYRYEDEEPGTRGRLGPMAEEVPPSWQIKMGNDMMGIKMSPYLGALHGAIRALGRETQSLREKLDAR